jgi:hypothetical protein
MIARSALGSSRLLSQSASGTASLLFVQSPEDLKQVASSFAPMA